MFQKNFQNLLLLKTEKFEGDLSKLRELTKKKDFIFYQKFISILVKIIGKIKAGDKNYFGLIINDLNEAKETVCQFSPENTNF